jgi:hypothetical protein
MSKSPSRCFPLTVTQLPVTRCEICQRTVAYRPGRLSEVLTEHYRRAAALPLVPSLASIGPAGRPCASRAGERQRSRSVAPPRKWPRT